MKKKKIIELSDIIEKIKCYDNKVYQSFQSILEKNLFFIYLKDKTLCIFSVYLSPRLVTFTDEVFYKIFTLKKLKKEDHLIFCDRIEQINQLLKQAEGFKRGLAYLSDLKIVHRDELRLNLSNYCTLNCKYCFQKEKNTQKLTVEQCKQHIDELLFKDSNLYSYKVTVCMTSEPLLDIHKIKELYFYLQLKSLQKLKNIISKEEIYEFLSIKSDEEYNKLLSTRDYYKSAFSSIDKRFITPQVEEMLSRIETLTPEEIKQLNREIIYIAISASKNLYYLWFTTNGTVRPSLYDTQFLKKLFEKAPMGISLDGNYFNSKNRVFSNGKSSYKQVMSNIKYFQKNGINLEVHCTTNAKNCNYIHLIKFFKRHKLHNIHFNIEKGIYSNVITHNVRKLYDAYISNKVDSFYGFETFKENLSKLVLTNCCATSKICIGYDNQQYFCDYFITNKNKDNIEELSSINVLNRPSCKNCPFNIICGGTCLALTKGLKDIDKNSCKLKQELFKQAIFYFGEEKLNNNNMEKKII